MHLEQIKCNNMEALSPPITSGMAEISDVSNNSTLSNQGMKRAADTEASDHNTAKRVKSEFEGSSNERFYFGNRDEDPEAFRLSNMPGCQIIWTDGKSYQTPEHLYQCQKFTLAARSLTDDAELKQKLLGIAETLRKTKGPNKAKIAAKKSEHLLKEGLVKWWAEWDIEDNDERSLKVRTMKAILNLKFRRDRGPSIKARNILLGTGEARLMHVGCPSAFWAFKNGKGQNKLGQLLEELRDELRAEGFTVDGVQNSRDKNIVGKTIEEESDEEDD